MRRIKKLGNKKGLTLIEIIISLALIGIISISFLTMFTAGIKQIAASGKKSQNIYVSQDQTEAKLLDGASSTSTDSLTITFPLASPITISMLGEKAVNGSVQFFIPK